MALLTWLMLSQGRLPAEPARIFALLATLIFLNLNFFMMLRSGRTDRYRALVFIVYALAFVVSFSANLLETRGRGQHHGRDSFPHLLRMALPFKATTEHVQITSFKVAVQTAIFPSLFIGLVVILSILMKRRTQCGLFCPFGAFQSFTNRINPFDIRIDRDRCADCNRCAQVCPTFSMDRDAIAAGQNGITCCRCGKCIDSCPNGAISFHIKGTQMEGMKGDAARPFFLYPAFLFLATMGGGMIRTPFFGV